MIVERKDRDLIELRDFANIERESLETQLKELSELRDQLASEKAMREELEKRVQQAESITFAMSDCVDDYKVCFGKYLLRLTII